MNLDVVKVFVVALPPALFEPPQTEYGLEQIVHDDKVLQFIRLPVLHEGWSCDLDDVDIGQANEDSWPD